MMTAKQDQASGPASGVVRALARTAAEIEGAAGLAGHLATATAVLDDLAESAIDVESSDAAALQDAWVDATGRLVKDADAMSPSDRYAVRTLRGRADAAWAALDRLTGRPASDAGKDGKK